MSMKNGSISVTQASSATDTSAIYESAVIKNTGSNSAFITLAISTGSATVNDLEIEPGQTFQIGMKYQFIMAICASGLTTTLKYSAVKYH